MGSVQDDTLLLGGFVVLTIKGVFVPNCELILSLLLLLTCLLLSSSFTCKLGQSFHRVSKNPLLVFSPSSDSVYPSVTLPTQAPDPNILVISDVDTHELVEERTLQVLREKVRIVRHAGNPSYDDESLFLQFS